MILTDKDEGHHPWGDQPNWQESAVLGWRDASGNIGGNHRIGIQPNRGTSCLWVGVFKDRNKIFRLNEENLPFEPMGDGLNGLQSGPQRMFHDGKDLRLQLDTPDCLVDLIVDDFKDSVEAFDNGGSMSATIYRSHFNLHCAVRGTVTLAGERHEISGGLGWRDHSWGPREWDGSLVNRSFHGNFGPGFNFHLLIVLTKDGKLDRRGHLVKDGKPVAFESFTIRTEMLEDGITPVQCHCHVVLPNGEALKFHSFIQKGAFVGVESFRHFSGSGDCSFEGRNDGYCYIEIGHNPRNGNADLQVAVGNTLVNGYHEIQDEPWKYEPL